MTPTPILTDHLAAAGLAVVPKGELERLQAELAELRKTLRFDTIRDAIRARDAALKRAVAAEAERDAKTTRIIELKAETERIRQDLHVVRQEAQYARERAEAAEAERDAARAALDRLRRHRAECCWEMEQRAEEAEAERDAARRAIAEREEAAYFRGTEAGWDAAQTGQPMPAALRARFQGPPVEAPPTPPPAAASEPRPTYNHTRGDSERNPCWQCAPPREYNATRACGLILYGDDMSIGCTRTSGHKGLHFNHYARSEGWTDEEAKASAQRREAAVAASEPPAPAPGLLERFGEVARTTGQRCFRSTDSGIWNEVAGDVARAVLEEARRVLKDRLIRNVLSDVDHGWNEAIRIALATLRAHFAAALDTPPPADPGREREGREG